MSFPDGFLVDDQFVGLLSTNPDSFLVPSLALHDKWVATAKAYLDPLALHINRVQSRHQRRENRKRKRSNGAQDRSSGILQLREVHTDGFTGRQVWEQANRVIKSSWEETTKDASLITEFAASLQVSETSSIGDGSSSPSAEQTSTRRVHWTEEDEFDGFGGELDGSVKSDDEMQSLEEEGEEEEDNSLVDISMANLKAAPARPKRTKAGSDGHGLDDGFFSLAEFNAQTSLFERKDTVDAKSDDESDEEDVDWGADPRNDMGGDFEMSDEDEFAIPDNADDGDDADDIKYADFFDPPFLPESAKSDKRPKHLDLETHETEPVSESELQRAISDVRRDLFEEDEMSDEESDGSSGNEDMSAPARAGGQSTHERRRAKIADEIRRLEAANVAGKSWTLAGEAKAIDRPVNSLIEEDLDFERIGKPVPVISNEVSDDIETLIKKRIVAKEFDEIIRRPRVIGGDAHEKREKFMVQDTKSDQSLAQLYESKHLQENDPGYVDQRSEKLKKEHDAIKQLWENIRSQLDTLSSWHHRPKAPEEGINVVTNVATISMEDARPTGGEGVSISGTLAPREIYAPGDDGKSRGEVILKSGAAISKEEMTREAKLRQRRREKERKKKRAALPGEGQKKQKSVEKQQVVSDLKKGQVKVIGAQGALTDIYGNKERDRSQKQQQAIKL
ncbi:hypothetical protein AJ80_04595 [Polytolypa hystricis UAMH7299]|uniref:U3 small nucleolar ribonucleoprotein protein MPP10 n=1 Tax=Polytolypa hystricis (strain UAMH7299) TaxID=1447883 RepID=A0A2B7Y1M1_POLH7|nr:hypothetical protein AJ80_04595 [Polytolypa hystricis UAMH7299]